MLRTEIDAVIEKSYNKLYQVSIPAVKYYLLTDVIAGSETDPLVQRTLEECKTYPPRLRLLKSLRPDGTWPISRERRLAEEKGPGPPVGWTYGTMLRNLYDLGEYQTTRQEGHVQAALDRIPWAHDESVPSSSVRRPGTQEPPQVRNGRGPEGLEAFEMACEPAAPRRWLGDTVP